MPSTGTAEQQARDELAGTQAEWNRIIDTVRDTRVSSDEEEKYRQRLHDMKDGYLFRFRPVISREFYEEALAVFQILMTDLDMALLKGRDTYEKERRTRMIARAKAAGSAALVLVLLFVIGKFFFGL